MAQPRDNFSASTIRALEARAGTVCSNPNCRAQTTAAHTQPNNVLRVGVAAHICAAAAGGPRYDVKMTAVQRADIANGIWLCQTCARLIDADEVSFPAVVLIAWKQDAEERIRDLVINGRPAQANVVAPTPLPLPHMDVELVWTHGGRWNRGYSDKNPSQIIDGEEVVVLNVADAPIIHWALDWHYELRLYNNSRREMFNVSVEFSESEFDEVTKLNNINNLAPLANFILYVKQQDYMEGTWLQAETEQKREYPAGLEGMRLTVRYRDDQQQNYSQVFQLQAGDFKPVP